MRRCRTCVYPNTKPDLYFDDTGQCQACLNYERRPEIDWSNRKHELMRLLDRYDGRCIVPSSGGKDSHYQVLTLLDLGAKVTVVTATTCMLTEIGRKNIDNLARHAPTIEYTPNMTQRAKLNRFGLEMVGDVSWPEHVAIFTVPFRAAVMLETPLIFYGENSQHQYGGPQGTEQSREMTRRWVSEFGGFLGLRPVDIQHMGYDMDYYMPPPASDLTAIGVEAHFLGQYIPWDSTQNAVVAMNAGMQIDPDGPCDANLWPWENLDNAMTGIHDHLMYRKYGYGRGAAQASVYVRQGKISRDEALEWVLDRDGEFPYDYAGVRFSAVLERIGMTESQFADVLEQFTDWKLFQKETDGSITLIEED